jgi:hypothetical protein
MGRKLVKNVHVQISSDLHFRDQGESKKFFTAFATTKEGERLRKEFHLKDYWHSKVVAREAANAWMDKHNYNPMKETKHSFIKLHSAGVHYILKFTTAQGTAELYYHAAQHGSLEEARTAAEEDGDKALEDPQAFVREHGVTKAGKKVKEVYTSSHRKRSGGRMPTHPKSRYMINFCPETDTQSAHYVARVKIEEDREFPEYLPEKTITKSFSVSAYDTEEELIQAAQAWRDEIRVLAKDERIRKKRKLFGKTSKHDLIRRRRRKPNFRKCTEEISFRQVPREVMLRAIYL